MLDHIPPDLELRRAWNELALQMEHPEVFYTWEWATAVGRAYREQVTPLTVLGYEKEQLVGAAALGRKNGGQVGFLTADTGDYCDFLSERKFRGEFIREILSVLRREKISNIVFTNLPADSASVQVLSESSSRAGYHLHSRPAYACARVSFANPEERATVKAAILARKRLRRNIRELSKRGTLTLCHQTDFGEIQELLPAFIRAHVARFMETCKISSLIREERRVFLTELARELSSTGWIAFSRLLVGDVTAAWNYGFRFAGGWFWYQPTVYDLFWDFSPGYCLLAKIVEEACDSPGINLVDLGLGAEGYKDRFATATRDTLYCELNRSMAGHWRTVARARAVSLATASPKIEKRIRAVISTAADLRKRAFSADESLASRIAKRTRRSLFHLENVLFFEWPSQHQKPPSPGTRLVLLESEMLGHAAVQYGDDAGSLRFLMRSAQRLRSGEGQGFVLLTEAGIPVHFCWARDFEGFHMAELDRVLIAPTENSRMIFDCFTPTPVRGNGFFAEAIALLAQELVSQGKSAWIFGAATNLASVNAIEKTAFQYRFTLGRKRILFWTRPQEIVRPSYPVPNQTTV